MNLRVHSSEAASESSPHTLTDGLQAGLRLHKFKVNTDLPRVKRVIGVMRALVRKPSWMWAADGAHLVRCGIVPQGFSDRNRNQ